MCSRYHAQKPRRPHNRYLPWDGDARNLRALGNGVSGITWAIDKRRVAKAHIGSARSKQDIETERQVYRRLQQPHPHVLLCLETDNPGGLVLERCKGSVRSRIRLMLQEGTWSEDIVMRWAYQAAKGLAYVHRHGIIHGDVGCHNMLLDPADTLKIADFAGSSIDGSSATVDYEVWSRRPGVNEPNEESDIFALGSAIYEMLTGCPPYHNLPQGQIAENYKKGQFPKLDSISSPKYGGCLVASIKGCWRQRFHDTQELVESLERRMPASLLEGSQTLVPESAVSFEDTQSPSARPSTASSGKTSSTSPHAREGWRKHRRAYTDHSLIQAHRDGADTAQTPKERKPSREGPLPGRSHLQPPWPFRIPIADSIRPRRPRRKG